MFYNKVFIRNVPRDFRSRLEITGILSSHTRDLLKSKFNTCRKKLSYIKTNIQSQHYFMCLYELDVNEHK